MFPKFWHKLNSPYMKRMAENSHSELIEGSLEHIRKHLSNFKGGNVSLQKDSSTGVAVISLDHPQKRNAMSGSMMVDLKDCIDDLKNWSLGKAVILTGKGDNFCSGADLDFVKANTNPRDGLNMSAWMQDALNDLHKLPLVSVCLVHGPTLGGGAEMSVSCDFIVAADNVKYGFVHGKMGIVPAFGGGVNLVRKIGQKKALDLLLTGKVIGAKECFDIGLADAIVLSEDALGKTIEWLSPRLQHHYTVIQAMKEITLKACASNSEEALNWEKHRFAPFWGSEINQEALRKNIKHVKKS